MSQRDDDLDIPMHRRRVTMPDGRYMYYYAFGDDAAATNGGDRDRTMDAHDAAGDVNV